MTPRLFRTISWIPLALALAIQLYARGFEGWGRMATAPLFLLPVILSLALLPVGIRLCRSESKAGAPVRPTAIATIFASVPALWFIARALFA
jgi:hypothetical protein